MIFGNEINKYSKRIAKFYIQVLKCTAALERNFIENLSIKGKIDKLQKYDLVIDPPYGQANSKYMSMGEDNYTKARNFTEYFVAGDWIYAKAKGLLIYVVGADNQWRTLFLDGGISEVKNLLLLSRYSMLTDYNKNIRKNRSSK